jgi:hypothetical protein
VDYNKTILKKFLLYIHPDFLNNFKAEQEINSCNIKVLTTEIENNINRQMPIKNNIPRSLTFYLKPNEVENKPRRVKVSTNRIMDSIRDILETLGVELPLRPEGKQLAYFSSNLSDFEEFMDSLIDR